MPASDDIIELNIETSPTLQPGYQRVNWKDAITDSFLNNLATNYFNTGQSKLYPFGVSTLASNPNLHNDFGY